MISGMRLDCARMEKTMNGITIAVLVIFALCGFMGWRKGILRIVLSLVTLVFTILATVVLTPVLSTWIKTNTGLYDQLEQTVYTGITKSSSYNEAVDQTVADSSDVEYIAQNGEISTYVSEVVNVLNLPDSMAEKINQAATPDMIKSAVDSGSTTVKTVVTSLVAQRIADIVFYSIIYVIVFMVVFVIVRIVVAATGVIGRLPIIHEANKIGGLAFGLAEGLVIVWLMFLCITMCSNTEWGAQALVDIRNNPMLDFIYNQNLILRSTFRNL